MTQKESRTIVFAGDSITDADRRADDEGLGYGYVRVIAERHAADPVRVVNAGISGDRVVDLQRRWTDDVLAVEPDVVTVLIGVNDMWRRYDSGMPTTAGDYRAGYDDILGAVAETGATIIVMEPFLVPISDEQRGWRTEDLDAKIAVARELAAKHGATLVPLDDLMIAAAEQSGAAAIAEDGVHPTAAGHRVIADAWESAWAEASGSATPR
jgi:acyl-CoA thioesterase I